MKKVLSRLYELQKLDLLSPNESTVATAKGNRLREQIPAEIFRAYERFRTRGRKGVALVRNGVCGECHLRIPLGTLMDVMHGELQRCGNCGRFLYLPEEQSLTVSLHPSVTQPSEAPTPRRKRKRIEPTAQAA